MTHETPEPDLMLSAFFINSLKIYLHMNKYINNKYENIIRGHIYRWLQVSQAV